jgi:hypothetical protein
MTAPASTATSRVLAIGRFRRFHRSGRQVACWALTWYVVVLVAFAVALNYWHPTIHTGGIVKLDQLRRVAAQAPDRPLLVMLGSSRTDGLFQASRLNGLPTSTGQPLLAYNFGVPMYGAMREWYCLRQLVAAGIRPRLLLLEVVAPFVNESHKGLASEENWIRPQWLDLSELLFLRGYVRCPGPMCAEWLKSRLAPSYVFRWPLHTAVLQSSAPAPSPAWKEQHDPWGTLLPSCLGEADCARESEATRAVFVPSLQKFCLGDGPVRALQDMLALCRREQIPVVLIVTPESSVFRSWYPPEAVATMQRLLGQLHDTWGVPVIDAREWLPDRDFIDGHHPLPEGSELFTRRLIEELRPMLVQSPATPYPSPSKATP